MAVRLLGPKIPEPRSEGTLPRHGHLHPTPKQDGKLLQQTPIPWLAFTPMAVCRQHMQSQDAAVRILPAAKPSLSPGITPGSGSGHRRNPLPREHCWSWESLIKPPCPLWGLDSLSSPCCDGATAAISSSGAARTLQPRELQARALWRRGEAFSSHHHPPSPAQLLITSWLTIRKEVEELTRLSLCHQSLSPGRQRGAGHSGQHSDLLHCPQQDQDCTWGFNFCSLELPSAVISQEWCSGLPWDAPEMGFGSAAPLRAQPGPFAKLTDARARSYAFTSFQHQGLSFNAIPNVVQLQQFEVS